MASKPSKPKLTDAERHKRFLDMAREVEVDDSQEAFDLAFDSVVKTPSPQSPKKRPKVERQPNR